MLSKTNEIKSQIFRFICVGILNTMVGYGLYAFFLSVHIHYFLALFFATCLGVIFNFVTIGKIVFKRKNLRKFFKFSLMYIILYFFGLILINLFNKLNMNLYFSGFFSIILLSILSFFGNKFIIFKNKKIKKFNTSRFVC